MMTKVTFVRPPNLQKSGAWKKQGVIRCPLNIALLAAYIREQGQFICSLVDFEVTAATTPAEMAARVLQESPKYVCITTLTPRYPTVIRMAAEIKRLAPEVTIIVGGPHVTGLPQKALYQPISYGIIGEGEYALLELLNALENNQAVSKIPNLVYRHNTTVKVNAPRPFIKNLDTLPFPAWDLMNLDEYTDPAYFSGSHLAIFLKEDVHMIAHFALPGLPGKEN